MPAVVTAFVSVLAISGTLVFIATITFLVSPPISICHLVLLVFTVLSN
jgi:hypothetical protein